MTQPLPILLAASLITGGAAGVGATMLLTPPGGTRPADTVVGAPSDDVLAAIEELRAENRELRQRVEEIEIDTQLAPVLSSGGGRSAVNVSESDLKDAIRDTLASMGSAESGFAPTPEMQSVVENVIEMREERERLEREQRRADAETERLENRLADLQTELGLDQGQVASMRSILQDERVRQTEMRDKMREARDAGTMNMTEMRDMWIEMRDTTNAAVEGVLSPSQYEKYEESQESRRWGRRGDGGGPDAPRGRRGG
ncbi:MAG: hypothetical protein AAF726_19010 [Planctomycetota bacterium]